MNSFKWYVCFNPSKQKYREKLKGHTKIIGVVHLHTAVVIIQELLSVDDFLGRKHHDEGRITLPKKKKKSGL